MNRQPRVSARLRSPREVSLLDDERLQALIIEAEQQAKLDEGDFIECGVCHGGTAAYLARTLMRDNRRRLLHLVDAWSGFPAPDPIKDGAQRVQGHAALERGCSSSLQVTRMLLASVGVLAVCRTHQGWFRDVLPRIPGPFSLAHIDGDLYQSTRDSLEYLLPRMTARGVIVVDDHGDVERRRCPGVRAAVDECIAGTDWDVVPLGIRGGSAKLTRRTSDAVQSLYSSVPANVTDTEV
jgi:hypothetical protein